MRILTADDVRAALPMTAAIAAMREAFAALSAGRVQVPARTHISTPGGVFLAMPANGAGINLVKLVSVAPGNADHGLPTVMANVIVLDEMTGEPLAMLDGRVLTAIRTGAASGLATDLLADQAASVLAVFGSGAQARTQIEAVLAVRPIREIRILSPRHAETLAAELREMLDGVRVIAAASARAACDGAGVIVTATNSDRRVIGLADVDRGAHINAIGAFTPAMAECAPDLVAAARVVVDQRAAAWSEAGDLIQARDAGAIDPSIEFAELGEIVLGRKLGRESAHQITLFKSVGSAAQDIYAAARVLVNAGEIGLGSEVAL